MKIVPLQTPTEYLDKPCLPHLLLNIGVSADIDEDIETNVEKFVLLPDENIEFFELGAGADAVSLIIAPPHFDILAVEEVESLDLVLQYFDDGGADLVFGEQILELRVVRKDVEDGEDVDAEVDVALVVLAEGTAEDGQEGVCVDRAVPCSRRDSRLLKSWKSSRMSLEDWILASRLSS
jgi:hypothetical protein